MTRDRLSTGWHHPGDGCEPDHSLPYVVARRPNGQVMAWTPDWHAVPPVVLAAIKSGNVPAQFANVEAAWTYYLLQLGA